MAGNKREYGGKQARMWRETKGEYGGNRRQRQRQRAPFDAVFPLVTRGRLFDVGVKI